MTLTRFGAARGFRLGSDADWILRIRSPVGGLGVAHDVGQHSHRRETPSASRDRHALTDRLRLVARPRFPATGQRPSVRLRFELSAHRLTPRSAKRAAPPGQRPRSQAPSESLPWTRRPAACGAPRRRRAGLRRPQRRLRSALQRINATRWGLMICHAYTPNAKQNRNTTRGIRDFFGLYGIVFNIVLT